MVPKQQIYIARINLMNLAGPMSILNIAEAGGQFPVGRLLLAAQGVIVIWSQKITTMV